MKITDLKGRQREVVDMLLRGYAREEMITMLQMSSAHITNAKRIAFEKLGITSEMQLLALAVRDAREQIAGELQMIYSAHAPIDEIMRPLAFIDEVLP